MQNSFRPSRWFRESGLSKRTVVLFTAAVLCLPASASPQLVVGDGWVNITGLGPVNLNELPADLRHNIRIPGRAAPRVPRAYTDLPPLDDQVAPPDLLDLPAASSPPSVEPDTNPSVPAPASDEAVSKQQRLQQLYRDRAFPNETIPEGAYDAAWEHIQKMPPAPPIPDVQLPAVIDSESLSSAVQRWLETHLFPTQVTAQSQPPPWSPIGPAPFSGNPLNALAGFIGQIALNPSDTNTVYASSFGGVWKSTNNGVSWTNVTSTQETQRTNIVVLHPPDIQGNSNVVFAGTGGSFRTCRQVPLPIQSSDAVSCGLSMPERAGVA